MKALIRLFGIIVIIAVIGFTFISCDELLGKDNEETDGEETGQEATGDTGPVSGSNTAWNVIVLIFKNLDAPDFPKASLNDTDTAHIKDIASLIPDTIASISGGLMTINKIKYNVIDEPIKVIDKGSEYVKNYTDHEAISGILDKNLADGNYNHIILVTPLADIAVGWAGLGGMVYKGIGVSEICHKTGKKIGLPATPPFNDAVFIHEMLHDLERISKSIKPSTADLHSNADYGFVGNGNGYSSDEWRSWYTAYMRNSPEMKGRGLDPRAYIVTN